MKSSSRTLLVSLVVCLLSEPAWSQEDDAEHTDGLRFPWARMNTNGTDLVFLLDRSGSVGHEGFETELTFVDNFVRHFDVMPNATRVAIVTFSDSVEVPANFLKDPGNKCQLSRFRERAIRATDYHGTNTGAGLQKVQEIFRNYSREHAPKVCACHSAAMCSRGQDPTDQSSTLDDRNKITIDFFDNADQIEKKVEDRIDVLPKNFSGIAAYNVEMDDFDQTCQESKDNGKEFYRLYVIKKKLTKTMQHVVANMPTS